MNMSGPTAAKAAKANDSGMHNKGVQKPRQCKRSAPHAGVFALQRRVGNAAITQRMRFGEDSRTAAGSNAPSVGSSLIGESNGQPLEASTRAFMESRFNADFGEVRIHSDERAHQSAAAVSAKAYTSGNNIVFAKGRLAPTTGEGRRLLAHELAHVVQQRRGGAVPALDRSAPHEHDAAQVAASVTAGKSSVTVAGATGVGIARDVEDESWTARLRRKAQALKEQIPPEYRTGLSQAGEEVKGYVRDKVLEGIGAAKGVATQVTEVVDTGLWLGDEYKNLREKAAVAVGGEPGSNGHEVVSKLIDATVSAVPGIAALPSLADAGEQAKAVGLKDESGRASLTAPLSVKLNAAGEWVEGKIGGTPNEPSLFTPMEKAEIGASIGTQVALAFTGAQEVKVALNVVGAVGAVRGVVETIRAHPDGSWKTDSSFWANLIGMGLSIVGLKHAMAATKFTTACLRIGALAPAIPLLIDLAHVYYDEKMSKEDRERKIKSIFTQVIHIVKDAILHVAQSQGVQTPRPDGEPPTPTAKSGTPRTGNLEPGAPALSKSAVEGNAPKAANDPVIPQSAPRVADTATPPPGTSSEPKATPPPPLSGAGETVRSINGPKPVKTSAATLQNNADLAGQPPAQAGSVTPIRKGGSKSAPQSTKAEVASRVNKAGQELEAVLLDSPGAQEGRERTAITAQPNAPRAKNEGKVLALPKDAPGVSDPRLKDIQPGERPVSHLAGRRRLGTKGPPPREPHVQAMPAEAADEGQIAVGQTHGVGGGDRGPKGTATREAPVAVAGPRKPSVTRIREPNETRRLPSKAAGERLSSRSRTEPITTRDRGGAGSGHPGSQTTGVDQPPTLPPPIKFPRRNSSRSERTKYVESFRDLLGPKQVSDLEALGGKPATAKQLAAWEKRIAEGRLRGQASKVASAVGAKPGNVVASRRPKSGPRSGGYEWEETHAGLRGEPADDVTYTVRTETDAAQFDSLGRPGGKPKPLENKADEKPPDEYEPPRRAPSDTYEQVLRNNRDAVEGLDKLIASEEGRERKAHELASQMERQARIAIDLKWPPVKWPMHSQAVEAYFTREVLPRLPAHLRAKIQIVSEHYFD